MKKSLVLFLLVILVLVAGCSDSTADRSSNDGVAESQITTVTEDKVWCADYVDTAVQKLVEQWQELYYIDGITDGIVEIKNTHVYSIKQPNDIEQFKAVDFIVQFELYTSYDMTNKNSSNKGRYETVVFLNTGDAWCYKYDPLQMYSMETKDYEAFVEKEEDLGSLCNDTLIIEPLDVIDEGFVVKDTLGDNANCCIKDEKGNVIISESDVSIVAVKYSKESGYYFYTELTEDGTEKFANATEENIGKTLSIYVNGVQMMAPTIMEPITDGKIAIAQNSEKEALINIFMMLTK